MSKPTEIKLNSTIRQRTGFTLPPSQKGQAGKTWVHSKNSTWASNFQTDCKTKFSSTKAELVTGQGFTEPPPHTGWQGSKNLEIRVPSRNLPDSKK